MRTASASSAKGSSAKGRRATSVSSSSTTSAEAGNPAAPARLTIEKRAYEIWESCGRQGDALEHWVRAERELSAAAAGETAAVTGKR